ncbi:MAG: DNA repair protein RadA [Planctomycetes bacterium]|nr:DNA repair protein RadA [Planctomycetota bacterium]
MAKVKVAYVCQHCGHKEPKWAGKCDGCGEFNSLVEEVERAEAGPRRPVIADDRPVPITDVESIERPRIQTGIGELDRVLGGGIVVGSVGLVGGDPGIGKSTLILQICSRIAAAGRKVLYVSSEESVMQTKMRADRLGAVHENLLVVSETNLDLIRKFLEELKPALTVVDSIQMIYRPEIPSAPGSVAQVRECAADLTYIAKRNGISLLIVSHVTKDGSIAGPKTLEHLVDAVFYFEGDRFQTFRVLRGVKNRFGSTNEIGVFEMLSSGLREVANPSELFMSHDRTDRVGSVVVPTYVGTRTLLVEIQALTSRTAYPAPTRRASGVDFNRSVLMTAVLSRRIEMDLGGSDIYVNAVGGVEIEEPAADLGIAVAIASSFRNRAVHPRTCAFGEVGLAAEIRGTTQAGQRVAEAKRLGFERAIVPADNLRAIEADGIQVVPVRTLREALEEAEVM